MELFDAFDLPSCTRRISATLPGSDAELVGYAVTCFDEAGISLCRLITSLHDLVHLRINEEGVVTDEDAERLHDELVRRETASIPVSRIEQINLAAARHQLLLDYLIINGLLSSRKHIGLGDPLFWREITALEQIGEDTCRREGSLRIPRIPVTTALRITPDLLFDLALPTMGSEGYMDAPAPLIRAAVESAMRLADGMHVARGTLTVDSFLNHLEKEIQKP